MEAHNMSDRPRFRYVCMDCGESTEDFEEARDEHGQCFTMHDPTDTHVVDMAWPHGDTPEHISQSKELDMAAKECMAWREDQWL
jgi:hypothetical protein